MPEQTKPQPEPIMGPWTLIGSGKFEKAYHDWARWLAFAGHPCFTLACFPSQQGEKDWYTPGEKALLDHVHIKKIDMSQAVLVLNEGGYIGESTIREIFYAIEKRKAVFSIEPFKNKAVKLSDRVMEFSSYMEDAPTEIYRVVGADMERYVVRPPKPNSAGEPTERTPDKDSQS